MDINKLQDEIEADEGLKLDYYGYWTFDKRR